MLLRKAVKQSKGTAMAVQIAALMPLGNARNTANRRNSAHKVLARVLRVRAAHECTSSETRLPLKICAGAAAYETHGEPSLFNKYFAYGSLLWPRSRVSIKELDNRGHLAWMQGSCTSCGICSFRTASLLHDFFLELEYETTLLGR